MVSFVSLGAYTWLSSLLLTVVNAALVGVVGWLLIKFLLGFIAKFLKKTKIDPLLHTVILSVTKIALLVLLAISVLDKLGIPTTSIITSLGAVGLAISLAVQDSIATLAGGVVILVLKPFNLDVYKRQSQHCRPAHRSCPGRCRAPLPPGIPKGSVPRRRPHRP